MRSDNARSPEVPRRAQPQPAPIQLPAGNHPVPPQQRNGPAEEKLPEAVPTAEEELEDAALANGGNPLALTQVLKPDAFRLYVLRMTNTCNSCDNAHTVECEKEECDQLPWRIFGHRYHTCTKRARCEDCPEQPEPRTSASRDDYNEPNHDFNRQLIKDMKKQLTDEIADFDKSTFGSFNSKAFLDRVTQLRDHQVKFNENVEKLNDPTTDLTKQDEEFKQALQDVDFAGLSAALTGIMPRLKTIGEICDQHAGQVQEKNRITRQKLGILENVEARALSRNTAARAAKKKIKRSKHREIVEASHYLSRSKRERRDNWNTALPDMRKENTALQRLGQETRYTDAELVHKEDTYKAFRPLSKYTGWLSGNRYGVAERERLQFAGCNTCNKTGQVKADNKADCVRSGTFFGWHMHTCMKKCPDCTDTNTVYLRIPLKKTVGTGYHKRDTECTLLHIKNKSQLFGLTPKAVIMIGNEKYVVKTTDLSPETKEVERQRLAQRNNGVRRRCSNVTELRL